MASYDVLSSVQHQSPLKEPSLKFDESWISDDPFTKSSLHTTKKRKSICFLDGFDQLPKMKLNTNKRQSGRKKLRIESSSPEFVLLSPSSITTNSTSSSSSQSRFRSSFSCSSLNVRIQNFDSDKENVTPIDATFENKMKIDVKAKVCNLFKSSGKETKRERGKSVIKKYELSQDEEVDIESLSDQKIISTDVKKRIEIDFLNSEVNGMCPNLSPIAGVKLHFSPCRNGKQNEKNINKKGTKKERQNAKMKYVKRAQKS